MSSLFVFLFQAKCISHVLRVLYTQSFSEMELLFQERQSHELFDTVVVVVVVELFIINKCTGLIFD